MARLLRSCIQDFVQEVPVGQGTPFAAAYLDLKVEEGEVKPPNTVQHATQDSADIVKLLDIGFN